MMNGKYIQTTKNESYGADVERLISASNLLKSPLRSTTTIETDNLYLFINYNTPPLYVWDPGETVHQK